MAWIDPLHLTGRVVHGGALCFQDIASRIDAVVPTGNLPIWTRGARHLPPPARYWFYNTEPLQVPRKRASWYLSLLDGAERVFDYSEQNLKWYPRAEFCPLRLRSISAPPDLATCDVDILFYGLPTTRRLPILEALPIRHVTAYGAELAPWLRRAKIVLSINAYDDVNANPLRIFSALEQGARLVMEDCQEAWFTDVVRPHVTLVLYADLVHTCEALLEAAHGA